jgi:hypothetical protein
LVVTAMVFTLAATLAIAGPARAAVVSLTAELSAEAEVPDPGPEGATGTAAITIDDATGEVCFELTIDGLDEEDAVIAAHIHAGEEGVAGDVVVPLFTEPPTGEMTGCVEGVDLELIADIVANPGEYYVNIHSEDFPAGAVRGQLAVEAGGGADSATVMVMKHNCADVATTAEFEAVEARAATNPTTPEAAFGMTVETVLECPTVVLPGDAQTAGAVAGGESSFDFAVADDDGSVMLSADGAFAASAACETDVAYDADRSGELDADVCLDLSHYAFEVSTAGQVTITETAAPSGFAFGAVRFTPGSGDDATLVSAGGGEIVLDVAADADGMVMLHVYNFAVAAAGPSATPAPSATAAPLPDTAASVATGSTSAPWLALAALFGTSVGVLALASRRIRD